jgi:hypothetical protein
MRSGALSPREGREISIRHHTRSNRGDVKSGLSHVGVELPWTSSAALWYAERRAARVGLPAAERPGGGKSMRNILALVAAVLILGAGLGWYLGWFHVQTTASSDGHQHISIDVDGKKVVGDIKHGVHEGAEKVEDLLKKEGVTPPPGSSPRVQISPQQSMPGAQGTYRVNSDGSVEYTGQVSYPQPVTK